MTPPRVQAQPPILTFDLGGDLAAILCLILFRKTSQSGLSGTAHPRSTAQRVRRPIKDRGRSLHEPVGTTVLLAQAPYARLIELDRLGSGIGMSDELAERASRRRKLRLVLPGEPDIHGVNVVIKRLEIDAMSLERPGPVDHVGKDIQGGVVQGLGYALHEEVTIGANGRVCQNGFETYRVPLALDVVPVEISLYEGAPSVGPLGTKGRRGADPECRRDHRLRGGQRDREACPGIAADTAAGARTATRSQG